MAVGYYQLSWLLYICWPAASYRLNAAFEDHAEHDYMLFVTEHPEWEAQPYDGSFRDGYGHHGSLADLFRQIGMTSGCTSWKASPPWPSRGCATTWPVRSPRAVRAWWAPPATRSALNCRRRNRIRPADVKDDAAGPEGGRALRKARYRRLFHVQGHAARCHQKRLYAADPLTPGISGVDCMAELPRHQILQE